MSFKIPSTITEQISIIESMDISYRTLHDAAILHNKENDSTIRIPFASLINKYSNYLYEIIITLESDATTDLTVYRYNPRKLSLDIYGTTEFWDVILLLNNCKSVIDFDLKEIKIYDPTRFKDYLNEIIINETELS